MISKKLRLALVSVCFPAMVFAQPGVSAVTKALPVDVDLGLKVGANFSKLEGSIWDDTYRTGFMGGAFGGVKFRRFGVTAEVLYSRVSFNYKPSSLAGSLFKNAADSASPNSFAVSTLSIPLLLNVKLVGPLWFQLGPQFTSVIGIGDENGFMKDAKSVFKSGNVSGVLGLQLNITKVNVGARYILGFSDMNNTDFSNTWRNRTIQLYLGYFIL